MSETSQGPNWWVASDGKWYPPRSAPPPPPQDGQTDTTSAGGLPPVSPKLFLKGPGALIGAGAMVIILVVVVVLVATSGKSTPPRSANNGNSENAGARATVPPTFAQVLSALESTGATLCAFPVTSQSTHEFTQSTSVCPGSGSDGLVWVFLDRSVSANESDLDARQELAQAGGSPNTAWIDGTIGVVDTNPAPGTAAALDGLGFTSYTYGS